MSNKYSSAPVQINVSQEWEMEWWPWRLGISRKELISAVKRVGPELEKVKRFISKK